MIRLAGVDLSFPTADVREEIQKRIPLDDAYPWLHRAWPGPRLVNLTVPTGFRAAESVRLGRFVWPRGAARWAYGHFLATSNQVKAVREVCYGKGGIQQNAVSLELSSPGLASQEVVEADVYVLPPTPIVRVPLDEKETEYLNGLYLITVVDERYYWWEKPCPDFAIDPATPPTWATLVNKCRDALGLTEIKITTAIEDKWLRPSPRLNLVNERIPVVLDAIAYNVGRRVVRTLNGEVRLETYDDAVSTFNGDKVAHKSRSPLAGGDCYTDAV